MTDLMTLDEVATYLRITRRTMYRLLKDEGIPAIKVRRQWRFDRSSIDDWLRQNSNKITASILAVDDDKDICAFFEDALEGTGVLVTTTADPFKGLELVKTYDYDLVFIDLKMPGMDGAELFKQIRAVKPDLPVTIITGFPDSELMASALAQGPFGIIRKPFTTAEVLTVINNYLHLGVHSK